MSIKTVYPLEKYRDGQGRYKTANLFVEFWSANPNKEPLYYLKENPRDDKYPSMYQIYMECVDEYEAAMRLVGTMFHWEKLCAASWFMDGDEDKGTRGLKAWREDMRRRDESKARALLLKKAEEGDTSAARAVLQDSKDRGKKKVGRPRKKQEESKAVDSKLAADILSFTAGKK